MNNQTLFILSLLVTFPVMYLIVKFCMWLGERKEK